MITIIPKMAESKEFCPNNSQRLMAMISNPKITYFIFSSLSFCKESLLERENVNWFASAYANGGGVFIIYSLNAEDFLPSKIYCTASSMTSI